MAREIRLKFSVLRSDSVGKTSILMRYVEHTYSNNVAPTLGDYFGKKAIQIEGKTVNILLWDVCNSLRFRFSPSSYLHQGTNGYVLVYDVSDRKSFNQVVSWREEIDCLCGHHGNSKPVVVVGNKCDLEGKREVTRVEGERMAASLKAAFFEVSAKTGVNINEAFMTLVTSCTKVFSFEERLSECRSRAAVLEKENMTMASRIKQLPKEIKAVHAQETKKDAERRASVMKKRSKKLGHHIQKDYQRVQSAVEAVAESRNRAHTAEEELRAQRERMVDMELRVREVERRAAELETQLRRTGRRGKGRYRQDWIFWAVQVEEVELTEEVLGKGSWATVYVARFRGLRVAAKCMHSVHVSDYNQRLFAREMNLAATIRHPNLIQFIGATVEGQPIILTELMSSSLRAELERQPLSPDQISSISLGVARALLYLHLMHPDPIIHRDISSANVLLNPGPNNRWLAKVSDYGSANYLRQVTTCGPGNPSYAAPEAAFPVQQTTKMDVYSYGVLLLEMWSRKFPVKCEQQVLLQGLRREEVREMVQRCLKHDPLQRPEMADIVEQLQ